MKHFLHTLLGFLYIELSPRVIWLGLQNWWLNKRVTWAKTSLGVTKWENAKFQAEIDELKKTPPSHP